MQLTKNTTYYKRHAGQELGRSYSVNLHCHQTINAYLIHDKTINDKIGSDASYPPVHNKLRLQQTHNNNNYNNNNYNDNYNNYNNDNCKNLWFLLNGPFYTFYVTYHGIFSLLLFFRHNVLNETSYLHYLLKSQERSQTYEHYSVRSDKFKRTSIHFSVNNYQ